QQLLTFRGCEVAHLVEDVIAGEQAFGLDSCDFSVTQQRRRVQYRLASSRIGRSDQAADDSNALRLCGDRFRGLTVAFHEPRALHQVARRVAANAQLGKENQVDAGAS